jgi:serine carboxypeptidase-like clade 1
MGNPLTNANVDLNARVPFAHLKALISDELYEVISSLLFLLL